jgi:hypothetical protein
MEYFTDVFYTLGVLTIPSYIEQLLLLIACFFIFCQFLPSVFWCSVLGAYVIILSYWQIILSL